MSYQHTEAFIEQDQIDWMGDGVLCQLVTGWSSTTWRRSRRRFAGRF